MASKNEKGHASSNSQDSTKTSGISLINKFATFKSSNRNFKLNRVQKTTSLSPQAYDAFKISQENAFRGSGDSSACPTIEEFKDISSQLLLPELIDDSGLILLNREKANSKAHFRSTSLNDKSSTKKELGVTTPKPLSNSIPTSPRWGMNLDANTSDYFANPETPQIISQDDDSITGESPPSTNTPPDESLCLKPLNIPHSLSPSRSTENLKRKSGRILLKMRSGPLKPQTIEQNNNNNLISPDQRGQFLDLHRKISNKSTQSKSDTGSILSDISSDFGSDSAFLISKAATTVNTPAQTPVITTPTPKAKESGSDTFRHLPHSIFSSVSKTIESIPLIGKTYSEGHFSLLHHSRDKDKDKDKDSGSRNNTFNSKNSHLESGSNKGSNKNFNSQTVISSPISISNSAPTTLTTSILPITERAKRYNLVKYPSFYSHIAYHFYYLVIESSFSNGTDYSTHFTGREAVNYLCTLLNTDDRDFALEVGQSLGSAGFFYHVANDLSLHDSYNDVYTFCKDYKEVESSTLTIPPELLPNGVVLKIAKCLSPTCNQDQKCYSPCCPNNQNQESNYPSPTDDKSSKKAKEKEALWETTVPPEILETISKQERKRQEIIFELIYTEKDFVKDLEILEKLFIQPLKSGNYLADDTKESFLKDVFLNSNKLLKTSSILAQSLSVVQEKFSIVPEIGHILLKHLNVFEPFKEFGANQVFSKRKLNKELKENPEFAKFVKERERLPECRKLPLQSFLGRPTTRLGRYPLLLEAILKCTPEGNPDLENIPKAIEGIKSVLSEINIKAGQADNKVRLFDLHDSLVGPQEFIQELDLFSDDRKIIREGVLKKKSGVDTVEVNIILFDHCILLAKKRKHGKNSDSFDLKISKKPIPLDLLSGDFEDGQSNLRTPTNGSIPAVPTQFDPTPVKLNLFPLTLTLLGRNGFSQTFICQNQADKENWAEAISQQVEKFCQDKLLFQLDPLADRGLLQTLTINCSAIDPLKQFIVVGTEQGLYLKFNKEKNFEKILSTEKISQITIIEEFNLVLLLSDKTLYNFPLNALQYNPQVIKKVMKKLSGHVSFFAVGECLQKTLICVVKSTNLSSTIKVFEPISTAKKSGGNQLGKTITLFNDKDKIKVFKEFYIPSESFSINFLKSKLCVGCAKGFEIVDLESLNTQGLLDPQDENLNFVLKLENVKPISFFRVKGRLFLLCYENFGFFVDHIGRLTCPELIMNWKGNPTEFSFLPPYILAFDPNFVEVRNVETGQIEQILPINQSKKLRTDHQQIHLVTNTNIPEMKQLVKIEINSSHPSNIQFAVNAKEVKNQKRRGMYPLL